MGEKEFGKCDVCGESRNIQRKYFYYDLKCECCSPQHFEIVSYCDQCKNNVKAPTKTTVYLKPVTA